MQHTRGARSGVRLHRGLPPSLHNPEAWFDFTDAKNTGEIGQHEVIYSIFALMRPSSRFEERFIRGKLEDSWRFYASVGTKISKAGFLSKKMNVFLMNVEREFIEKCKSNNPRDKQIQSTSGSGSSGSSRDLRPIRQQFTRTSSSSRNLTSGKPEEQTGSLSSVPRPSPSSSYEPPSLKTKPNEWFDFFDRYNRSFLSQNQIIHGLYVTLKTNDAIQQTNIRKFIEQVWPIFSVHSTNGLISKNIFIMGDGLADCIIQNVLNNNLAAAPGGCDFLQQQKIEGIQIQVNIPLGMKPGQKLKVQSPRSTNDLIVLTIPEQNNWGSGSNGSYFLVTL